MRTDQVQSLRRFRRVREFIGANAPAGAPATLGRPLAELDDVLVKLTKVVLEQESGTRLTNAETKRQGTLRDVLWEKHMLPVSQVGREVSGALTGSDAALRMPRKRTNSERLVAAAGAMAEAAERQKTSFVEHGLPAEFVQQLRDAAATLQGAIGVRDTTQRRRITATAAAAMQIKRGCRAVRLLNAIITPRLAGDADLLATWKLVRKVAAPPSGSIAGDETPPVAQVA